MKNKGLGIAIAFVIIAFVIVYAVTGGFFTSSTTIDAGSMTIEFPRVVAVEQPLTASTAITDGHYDSFDLALGTSFVASSTQPFLIGGFSLTSSATEVRVDYGYGDDHVENSVSAPTNAVTVGSFVIPSAAGLERVPVFVRIPIDKHPFVRVVGDVSNGHITIIGVAE